MINQKPSSNHDHNSAVKECCVTHLTKPRDLKVAPYTFEPVVYKEFTLTKGRFKGKKCIDIRIG